MTEDGVDQDSVQACVFGVAAENLGITEKAKAEDKIDQIYEEQKKNNQEYSKLVLTFYGLHTAKQTVDMMAELTGYRIPEERVAEVVAETVNDFLSKVIL